VAKTVTLVAIYPVKIYLILNFRHNFRTVSRLFFLLFVLGGLIPVSGAAVTISKTPEDGL
jgi:hypothetical protein